MHGPISHNGNFYSNDVSSPKKDLWFQIFLNQTNPLDTVHEEIAHYIVYLPILKCKFIRTGNKHIKQFKQAFSTKGKLNLP